MQHMLSPCATRHPVRAAVGLGPCARVRYGAPWHRRRCCAAVVPEHQQEHAPPARTCSHPPTQQEVNSVEEGAKGKVQSGGGRPLPEAYDRFKVGYVYCGVVRTAKAFGARIALEGGGGVAGWLYVAQLSHERMAFVDRVMREGDDVKVMVAGRNGRKLTLSTKALERTAGDMLRDPQLVYYNAEVMAQRWREEQAWRLNQEETGAQDLKRKRAPKEEMKRYEAGAVVAGVVQTVTPYDAHVDLGGGVSGVLHAREVSSVAVEDPRAVLREGDGVTALVTRVNAKAGLVTLSTRLLEPSPGDMLHNPQLVHGKAAEMAERWRDKEAAFREERSRVRRELGQKAKAHVGERQATAQNKEDRERYTPTRLEAVDRLQVKGVYGGVVQSVKPYGVFVELKGGVVGLLHISQISHGRVTSTSRIFTEGPRVKVMVLTRDSVVGHVTLNTKKLEPTPGDMLRDPQLVYDRAEEMGQRLREKQEARLRKTRAKKRMSQADGRGNHVGYGAAVALG